MRLNPFIRADWVALLLAARQKLAEAQSYLVGAYFRAVAFCRLHQSAILWSALVLVLGSSVFLVSATRPALNAYFEQLGEGQQDKIANFRALVGAVGGALVGATAIAFSVVMFSVQINFARMPYGLFRRLSTDKPLLGFFVGTFILAFLVAITALVPAEYVTEGVWVAGWSSALSLILFILAYRRSLELINPIFQISLVEEEATKALALWGKHADRSSKLLALNPGVAEPSRDIARAGYFALSPNWTGAAKQAISHAIAFARSYGLLGDYEVSRRALQSVVVVNDSYILAKGKTFFTLSMFGDSPESTDGVVNHSLEILRQHIRDALLRKDERAVELALQTVTTLAILYSKIDYGRLGTSGKFHAKLAGGYLSDAVKAILAHDMPDVVMEGVRQLGKAGNALVVNSRPNDAMAIVETLALLGAAASINEKMRPVTRVAVRELTSILIATLRCTSHDVKFATKRINENVELVAETVINQVPDTVFTQAHGDNLSAFYSLLSESTLPYWLTGVANALSAPGADTTEAKRLVDNVDDWAESLPRGQKTILLLAIGKRSLFTQQLIAWISLVSRALMLVANSSSSREPTSVSLRRSSAGLVWLVSQIPNEKEAVKFVTSLNLIEELFEIGFDAIRFSSTEPFESAERMLFDWVLDRGHFLNDSEVEEGLAALATLSVLNAGKLWTADLNVALAAKIKALPLFDHPKRTNVARRIRRRVERLGYDKHSLSRIDNAMSQTDPATLRARLLGIADLLMPPPAPPGAPSAQ